LAKGLGYDGEVTSPTFTLSRVYKLPQPQDGDAHPLELHHYDLYRLGQAGIVGSELAEDLADPHIVTAIEWAGIFEDELPADRLRIKFDVTGDTARNLVLTATGPKSKRLTRGLEE
jgi:tRNA threonylcarbamoyladenosine biosynthesis protein TsaE